MDRRRAAVLLSLIALTLTGCGYGTHALFRDDIKTIYVEFLGNDTFRRGLEVPLTQDVVKEVELRTPLRFAARDEADSVLSGTITGADVRTITKSTKDKILLQRATVAVRFRWRDRLTGRDIVAEKVVTESARVPVVVSGGVFESSADQGSIFDLALREAARRIVENMEQSW